MATIGTQATDRVQGVGPGDAGLIGAKHERLRVTDISNGEQLSPGSKSIIAVAFEPDDLADIVVAQALASTSIVTFAATGGPHSGHLHVWSRGY